MEALHIKIVANIKLTGLRPVRLTIVIMGCARVGSKPADSLLFLLLVTTTSTALPWPVLLFLRLLACISRGWVLPVCCRWHTLAVYCANEPLRRMSREEEPTLTPNVPWTRTKASLAIDQMDVSKAVSGKVTVADWPGARTAVFWKPLSCSGGSPAAAGNARYSWATSAPATVPVFLIVALMAEGVAINAEYLCVCWEKAVVERMWHGNESVGSEATMARRGQL